MTFTTCTCCGGDYFWIWEDAFNKFGFDDGEGMVMTSVVAHALKGAGYSVERHVWGAHNEVIMSIQKDGIELIPHDRIQHGYDDPRDYLPADVVALLDAVFAHNTRIDI